MPKQKKNPNKDDNTLAQLKQFLVDAGIPTHMFHDLLDRSIRLAWTPSEFMLAVYGSPQFQHMFPGIFRPDGSLRMTPYEYRSMADSYQSEARKFGITNLSQAHIGKLISGEVSATEFTDRMTAIQRVNEFKPAFDEFKQVLKARGIPTKGIDSEKDIVNFMLGKGPKQFYDIWDEMTVGTAARTAGVGIDQKTVRSIAKRLPGQADEAAMQGQFAKLAQDFKSLMPLSRIGKYGLSKQDLVNLEFGGPNQAAVAEKVNLIMKNQQAFAGQRARTVAPQIGTIQQDRAQVG